MDTERTPIENDMVDALALQMKAKLQRAREKGRGGWHDPADCTITHLWDCLAEHTHKTNLDMVDVANIAGMVWWRLSQYPEEHEVLAAHVAVQRHALAEVGESPMKLGLAMVAQDGQIHLEGVSNLAAEPGPTLPDWVQTLKRTRL